MADDRFEDLIWVELTFDGVVHRMSMSPEQARRWLEREEAIGMGRGEPMVEKDGRLVEHHGFDEDPHVEPVEPTVLGWPIDLEDWEQ